MAARLDGQSAGARLVLDDCAGLRPCRDEFGKGIRADQIAAALTPSQRCLSEAKQAGTPLADYARSRAVSLNTVYFHLRQLKEKTGCNRMAELR